MMIERKRLLAGLGALMRRPAMILFYINHVRRRRRVSVMPIDCISLRA